MREFPIRSIVGAAGLRLAVLIASCIAVAIPAKYASGAPQQKPVVTLAHDIQPIFDQQCVACHVRGAENAGLNLQEGQAFKNLVSQPSTQSAMRRVQPGQPSKSYLLHKLRDTHVKVGGSGTRMPMGNDPLDGKTIDLIAKWIAAGALQE